MRRRSSVGSFVGAIACLVAAGAAARAEPGGDEDAGGAAAPAGTALADAIDQFSAGPPPRPTVTNGDSALDRLYDDVQEWKEEAGLPVGFGAWHWWHYNREAPHDFRYGTPVAHGTLLYYVTVDPTATICLGGERKAGVHAEYRLRDDGDLFRPFFTSNTWFWELYAWMDTGVGRLKAGQVWRRFGYDWDGSWHGTIQHFTGQKFDPDWGASLESEWKTSGTSKVNTWAQWFFAEDRVNGSYPGGDPESDPDAKERRTFVARAAATKVFGPGDALVLGVSGQTQEVANRGARDEMCTTVGVDANWISGPLRVFGEISRERGVQSRAFLLTGGPTDERVEATLGATYQAGPVTLRAFRSTGDYEDPGAKSVMYLAGATIAVTKNVDLYLELVHWTDRVSGAPGRRSVVENEFDILIQWRF